MISSNCTTRTVIQPTSFDKADEARASAFEMSGRQHSFVFDGKLEDSIVKTMLSPEESFTSLDQLTALCKDEKGGVVKAAILISEGAETVKVDVGLPQKWTARAAERPGVIELRNEGGIYGNDQTIRLRDGYVSLTTRAETFNNQETVQQKLVGKFNSNTGTITCVREEIERNQVQEAPAPLTSEPAL